ncbi:hypothetical protein, variant [Verruconis gallopava]|uniref:Zn(2)-C6 fungal-type domain-containing protein n=1 Tax=Verruconis gallopava TaxID=253628 RepID=A0A0D2AB94_9PEZI|nr:hypothetical protein, variant [Verruconis gallopava]KIW04048.1 hypothetical protein, variant [Verruconis gallopava]
MSLPDMAAESISGARPILPQSTQTSGFQFANTGVAHRDVPQQRNYVFVDEHNRHKRLKVMRACEGCRRRKIKCDAATTNSWPCAACTRLKLNCVPPTVSYEKDSSQPGVHTFEIQRPNEYPAIPIGTIGDYQRPQIPSQPSYQAMSTNMPPHVPSQTYEPLSTYSTPAYMTPTTAHDAQYAAMPATTMSAHSMAGFAGYTAHSVSTQPRNDSIDASYHPPLHRANSLDSSWNRPPVDVSALRQNSLDSGWRSEPGVSPSADVLAEAMGGLKIDHLAIAPYIADRNKLAEAPAVAEYEVDIPQHSSPDQPLSIPPEMMPSDEQALQYFQYFFANIHPYVPVLNRQFFYQQWSSSRNSISPLLLEAIFACTTMTLEDHAQASKWLALATKHEESFKDVPRLSTIQASLILLKAREGAPKRGYFYRSWMTVVNVVAMAKDLNFHEHKADHDAGQPCGSSPYECVAKTRIWQLLYILEGMIGGPQGRRDFSVDPETVDFNPPARVPGLDETDFQVSFQFVYLARLVQNVRGIIRIYAKVKKLKDWYLDPEFVGHDQVFPKWLRELPQSLLVVIPEDGSTPYLPNSFTANMNCYHYLSVVMQHRPQVHYLTATDGNWRQHMIICHDAAKKICRIQEAILENFGMPGMLCMLRGISFTVYCVLTCVMLHLASITSPDPELNCEARDYFVRHMRILEQVIPHWPLPEVQAQVNSLREAFSADTSKPFDLKPSFPFGSPSAQNASPITDVQGLAMMGAGQPNQGVQGPEGYQQQWNPTKIFDQWNAAFGTPASSTSQPSPPMQRNQPGTFDVRSNQEGLSSQYHSTPPQANYAAPDANLQMQTGIPAQQQGSYPPSQSNSFVSPSMWQQVVANSLVDGRKRMWTDYNSGQGMSMDAMAKRQR